MATVLLARHGETNWNRGADIDEAAWATLYTTESRPFQAPATGKIAVKVINHYGDEVMKVYAL